MKDRKENETDQSYHFIKEIIKKRPSGVKVWIYRALSLAAGGLILGGSAAFAFVAFIPSAVEKFGLPREDLVEVELSGTPGAALGENADGAVSENSGLSLESDEDENEKGDTGTVSGDSGRKTGSGLNKASSLTPLEEYEQVYDSVLEIARKPRQAMVHVLGISEDEDLLDNSFLSAGDEQGIIFLESDTDLYILTGGDELAEAEEIQVEFADETFTRAEMCGSDAGTGLAVIRVPKIRVQEKTLEEISVACLGDAYSLMEAKPVIAIGSPSGQEDGVVYGMVTSITGKISIPDGEYSLLVTDMQGSPESDGVLLDTSGNVIGLIMQYEDESTNMIKAVSVAQLKPVIQMLCNNEPVKYLGICGVTISKSQATGLGVPEGIYVDSVETDSPAMVAGIQSGDIITGINGEEITSMQSYFTKLQELTAGATAKLSLVRRSAVEREYVEMDFDLTIEKR